MSIMNLIAANGSTVATISSLGEGLPLSLSISSHVVTAFSEVQYILLVILVASFHSQLPLRSSSLSGAAWALSIHWINARRRIKSIDASDLWEPSRSGISRRNASRMSRTCRLAAFAWQNSKSGMWLRPCAVSTFSTRAASILGCWTKRRSVPSADKAFLRLRSGMRWKRGRVAISTWHCLWSKSSEPAPFPTCLASCCVCLSSVSLLHCPLWNNFLLEGRTCLRALFVFKPFRFWEIKRGNGEFPHLHFSLLWVLGVFWLLCFASLRL